MEQVLEAPGPTDLVVETQTKKFYNHKNEKLPSQKATSVVIYRNIILYIFMK